MKKYGNEGQRGLVREGEREREGEEWRKREKERKNRGETASFSPKLFILSTFFLIFSLFPFYFAKKNLSHFSLIEARSVESC